MSFESTDEDYNFHLILDNGSTCCKAGYAGDGFPVLIFPNMIGRPHKGSSTLNDVNPYDIFIGDDARDIKQQLSIDYPIEYGIVKNWDDMEKIWAYTFLQLCDDLTKFSLLTTEAPFNPKANREKMTQIFFETFDLPELYISMTSLLALKSAHYRTCGVVVELGDVISVVPFYEDSIIAHAATRLDFGGRAITDYLMKLLAEKGYSFSTTSEREIVRDIKETNCYVANDLNVELRKKNPELSETLSCGEIIKLGNERFQCTEILFQPSLIGLKVPGVHKVVYDTIMKCDVDTRKVLFMNIIITGGTSLFPGFVKRFSEALTELTSFKVKVIAPPEREMSVWMGGSVVASQPCFESCWFRRKEYEEYGPSAIHRKCF